MPECRACKANIVWLLTSTGKKMPVNAESAQPTDTLYDKDRHVAHWGTCTGAGQFRKEKE